LAKEWVIQTRRVAIFYGLPLGQSLEKKAKKRAQYWRPLDGKFDLIFDLHII